MELTSITAILMTLLSLFMVILILFGFNAVLRRTPFKPRKKIGLFFRAVIIVVVWIIAVSGLSLSGFLGQFGALPPRPFLLIVVPLIFILYLAFTNTFRKILLVTPKSWLINIQFFRVIVEVILWLMLLAGQIPIQMTFEGSNFDILAGLTAIPFAVLCFSKGNNRINLAIIWNVFGLLLLINILTIAVLSMPSPIRYFMNEPANTIVAEFPYAFLPGILVTVAYSMHIFSLRQLFLMKKSLA